MGEKKKLCLEEKEERLHHPHCNTQIANYDCSLKSDTGGKS